MVEKRVFLAIFLSFLILALYQTYVVPPPDPAAGPAPAASGAPPPASGAAGQVPAAAAPSGEPAPAPPAAAPVVETLVADTEARDIVVETEAVRAVFSTAGGILKSWALKKYLAPDGGAFDLVPQEVPASYARPFTLATDDPAMSLVLARALYQPSETSLSLGRSPGTLSFVYRDVSGLNARKTFHFQPEGKTYQLSVEAAVDVGAIARPVVLSLGPVLGPGLHENGGNYVLSRGLIFRDGSVDRLHLDDLTAEPRYSGGFRFAGVEDHYFLMSVLRPESATMDVLLEPTKLPPPSSADPAVPHPDRQFVSFTVTTPGAATLSFFLGPKDFEELKAVDQQLVRAIDFGIFAAIIVPLLGALKSIYGYTENYGWAIIILTILINLAIFPLRHRSMVSMRKMQALQPAVKAIQDRYAKYKFTDPERQKMNQEMMALYKQKGVNPASGCVPMLLTMPVLFAFYQMLASAIELRGAPFFGWIQDLSKMDPWFITPLIMGGTMFWQQKMMPTTADPVQAKMFMFMPVVFTVMFLWAPSGLVIYWLVSNVMAIGQQYLTNRIIGAPARPPRAPVAAAVADRSRKRT